VLRSASQSLTLTTSRQSGARQLATATSVRMLSCSSPEIPSYIELPATTVTKENAASGSTWVTEPTMQKLRANCITELIGRQFGRSFK
jgi:hypothetical protein